MTPKTRTASALTRRSFVCLTAATAASAFAPAYAQGTEAYPTRPIRLVVPVPAGGPVDRPARVLAERLQARLGQSVVVDNRPGASGMLATSQVLHAPPDGYTLLLSTLAGQITAPLLMDKPSYDGARDFVPIGGFGRFNAVLLVNDKVPVRNLQELIAYGKQHPGKLNYGTPGIGTIPHLQTELLKMRTGLDAVHVPYKGGAAMVQALVADEVQVLFGEVFTALPFVRSGRLRPLGVVTARRVAVMPDVPTLSEQNVRDLSLSGSWMGLSGPRGLPGAVTQRLVQALAEAAQDPEIKHYFANSGGEAIYSSPDAFKALWATDQKTWGEVIKANNIRLD
ncbi:MULTISPECIES: tripartite tricarboxylate transporter substrate binding protein [unclassified Variovorax]|jgi:tripartite-type tricarboxylate transporter receptor subunit TctC|uniref:Bug family tripartite tricarboxylate transporter substrate binding protein n=1 Tax=unclassified Variovorax TaxID=663243 RepID=UPI001119F184|nr:tripartite tricarboxylate transporter substrate binding protein [Variovorax sp. KBS0712]TSD56918.1 tripartite tricarboxylate transporter substrate binding protein [Variovorax sp. KBS0712]